MGRTWNPQLKDWTVKGLHAEELARVLRSEGHTVIVCASPPRARATATPPHGRAPCSTGSALIGPDGTAGLSVEADGECGSGGEVGPTVHRKIRPGI